MEWVTGSATGNVMIRWFHSLYFRLTLILIVVLALTLAAVGICMSYAVDQEVVGFSQELETARTTRLSEVLGGLYSESGDWEDIQSALELASALDGRQFLLVDQEGQVVRGIDEERRRLTPLEVFLIRPEGRDIGTIQLPDRESATTTADPQWSQISSEVNQWLIWIGLAVGCVGVLLVSVLFRQTLRPVRALTSAARSLGEGDLSQRVPEGDQSELGLLSNTFNTMVEGLEKAERQRRNLMADVAHELRTPLFNIQGHLEAIKDGTFEPDTDTIEIVHQQVGQLANLVEEVRLLALAESRALHLDIQPHSVVEVLERCMESFQPQAELKGLSLEITVAPDIPATPMDRTRIAQVVGNLLQNAIFHTPSGGEVAISARKVASDRISIVITDTGPGIPEESLPFLFDRFYRVDPARDTATGGSGLGLAIAKELVEAHGGVIYAENNIGKGSHFAFELPLTDPLSPGGKPDPKASGDCP